MTQISKRLSVEGPDVDGEYEVTLADDGCDPPYSHYITRAEADALIATLQQDMGIEAPRTLQRDLAGVLNCHSQENASNTPDFILAQYLFACLAAWNTGVQQRETWYGRDARPSGGDGPQPVDGVTDASRRPIAPSQTPFPPVDPRR